MGLQVPIIHMPYFIPLSEEESSETEIAGNEEVMKPYFLFVGRLEKIKGLQNLIPIFKEYSKAELLIAGDGEYGEVLRKLADGIENVKFLGRVNHKELRRLYKKALAVIVPSICYEVFGIIIIEAFSMKTPVIVNNVGAPPDVIEESGGGFIYNNKEELIRAMETLRTSPQIRKELGEKGYTAYKKYWTEENGLRIYFDLISRIAQKKNIDLLSSEERITVA